MVNPTHWSLARLKREIRRLVESRLDRGEVIDHLLPISHVIFLISVFFGKSANRLNVGCIFRVDIRTISRRLSTPTSPHLIKEATEALHLLREHAIAFGCWGGPEPAASFFDCPPVDAEEDWLRWAPAYLRGAENNVPAAPWA